MPKAPKLPRWAVAGDDPGFLKGIAALENAARLRRRQYGAATGFVELAARHAAEREHGERGAEHQQAHTKSK